MTLTPAYEDFAAGYGAGENQIVFTRLAADLDTPVSLMLKLTGAAENAFVLESVTGGEVRGRYSIIGMKPDLIWRCRGETSAINRAARYDAEAFEEADGNPLDVLRSLIAESRIDLPEDLPQAAAGLFGYLGYDMIRLVERLPDVNPDPLGLPDALMLRPSVIAVLDGVKGEVTIVSPAWVSDGQTARAAYAQAAERVMDAVRDLERAMPGTSRDLGDAHETPEPVSNFTRDGYKAAVEKARDYIKAGDIFQVVPSQRWAQGLYPGPLRALPQSCGAPTPRPSCSISTSAAFMWWVPAPRSWSGSLAIRSPSAPWQAPGQGATHRKKTAPWKPICCWIKRSWPSISCFWILAATTRAA